MNASVCRHANANHLLVLLRFLDFLLAISHYKLRSTFLAFFMAHHKNIFCFVYRVALICFVSRLPCPVVREGKKRAAAAIIASTCTRSAETKID
jgi:hypothetical protein